DGRERGQDGGSSQLCGRKEQGREEDVDTRRAFPGAAILSAAAHLVIGGNDRPGVCRVAGQRRGARVGAVRRAQVDALSADVVVVSHSESIYRSMLHRNRATQNTPERPFPPTENSCMKISASGLK